jgi:hypothetical protein
VSLRPVVVVEIRRGFQRPWPEVLIKDMQVHSSQVISKCFGR